MTGSSDHTEEAYQVLISLGLPRAQHNERSALCLLALLNLTPAKTWVQAENALIGITPIMDWAREHYGKDYAPNTGRCPMWYFITSKKIGYSWWNLSPATALSMASGTRNWATCSAHQRRGSFM